MNTGKLLDDPIKLGLGLGIVAVIGYFLLRKAVGDTVSAVASTAGGIVSGNNALTEGTPYAGAGVLGTLGAATNAASGGAFQSIGEAIAGWFDPEPIPGGMVTYMVIFPDNSRHAVNSEDIGPGGYFIARYNGKKYRMGVNQAGQKVAAAA